MEVWLSHQDNSVKGNWRILRKTFIWSAILVLGVDVSRPVVLLARCMQRMNPGQLQDVLLKMMQLLVSVSNENENLRRSEFIFNSEQAPMICIDNGYDLKQSTFYHSNKVNHSKMYIFKIISVVFQDI